MSESPPEHETDFVDRVLASVDHLLDVVHDRVLRPIIVAARVVAYGAIMVVAATVLVGVVVIMALRFLDVYAFNNRVWVSYAVLGALSLIVGLVIWRRRRPIRLRKP